MIERASVAILDDYQNVALSMAPWERLPKGVSVRAYADHVADEAALIERLKPYDAVVLMRERTPFPRRVIDALPNLKLVITTGRRNASLDVQACLERGIVVCGTDGSVSSTAELTWGLILALLRGIVSEDRAVREGRWQIGLGNELSGKTLGILGLGRLGTQVARIGQAFGMRTIAWSQNLMDEQAAAAGVQRVEKEGLFSEADVLTIHLVLGERTRRLVGARELGLMKPTAYVVNTSRGQIIDEDALVAALRSRAIAGAALDVFDVEPLPSDHPLRTLPNTVTTPHIGYVSAENYRVYFEQALENVEGWLQGTPRRELQP